MTRNEFKFTRRHLPHWTAPSAIYFITFRTLRTTLSDGEIEIVLDHIKSGQQKYYKLIAAVIMPDHVHALLSPNVGYDLNRIMKGVKGVSARKINKIRGTLGSIWQDESFDRIIRNETELIEKLTYMLNNPVKKGLVEDGFKYHGWYINEDYL
jgi:putative transposase